MGSRLCLLGGALWLIAPSAALPAEPPLAAIDLFGTEQISLPEVEARVGDRIREMVRQRPSDPERAQAIHAEIVRSVESMGDFAWVGLGVITYFQPEAVYVTVDVVDAGDREARMPFRPEPAGDTPDDPAGLVAAMAEFLDTGRELMMAGEIGFTRVECPAFHCLFGFEHPRLAPFGERFESEVAEHRDELAALLERSPDAEQRARAAYLLAHLDDGDDVVGLLVPAILDPDSGVRNNAMRVLADIALFHPEVEVPIDPILTALHFPATTDRNKAAAILSGLANDGEHHDAIAERAGPVLLEMLRLRQPNNRDFAHQILTRISGQSFDGGDSAGWEAWLEDRQRGARGSRD